MISQQKIIELFELWSKSSCSKLLTVNQKEKFEITFVVDESLDKSQKLIRHLREITEKKHPSGSLSFIGYHESSIFKKWRIQFSDITNEKIDWEKVQIYLDKVRETIGI